MHRLLGILNISLKSKRERGLIADSSHYSRLAIIALCQKHYRLYPYNFRWLSCFPIPLELPSSDKHCFLLSPGFQAPTNICIISYMFIQTPQDLSWQCICKFSGQKCSQWNNICTHILISSLRWPTYSFWDACSIIP